MGATKTIKEKIMKVENLTYIGRMRYDGGESLEKLYKDQMAYEKRGDEQMYKILLSGYTTQHYF